MKKIFNMSIFLLTSLFFYTCSSPDTFDFNEILSSATNYKKVDYKKTILLINDTFEDGGTWDELFANNYFLDIYEHSNYYRDSAISFLSSATFNDMQKTICIYSMQRQTLDNYISILAICVNIFEKGAFSELLLSRVISPNFGKRKIIAKNYDDIRVKNILIKIKESKKASIELKSNIAGILSGVEWKNMSNPK
jgi:hypothetical protein